MKFAKIFLLFMSLIAHKMSCPMETTEGHETEQPPIIGILMINSYEKRMCYAGDFFAPPIEQALDIKVSPSEPIVEIIAIGKKTAKGVTYYSANATKNSPFQSFGHLPRLLPLSMIDKKEGETIKLIAWGRTIELTCQQKSFQRPSAFEDALGHLKELFIQQPHFHIQDEELLIKAGIIVKDHHTYKNGPNGYKNN